MQSNDVSLMTGPRESPLGPIGEPSDMLFVPRINDVHWSDPGCPKPGSSA